jgi:hypothetical protein
VVLQFAGHLPMVRNPKIVQEAEEKRMRESHGRFIALSPCRRFIGDLLHFARKVPVVTIQRRMALGPLVTARAACQPPPGWAAVFVKAYALVAGKYPPLRRAYLPLPWPHIYEHPYSVASVAVERCYRDETGVFFAVLKHMEARPISEISDLLRQYKQAPLKHFGTFRRILRVTRLPWPLRRLLWWLTLNLSGRFRARYLGTFGMTAVSGMGATINSILCPLTTALTYDVFLPDGSVDVRLVVDHRVLDGGTVARALAELEAVLLGEILAEIRSGGTRRAA